jgi:hypothetical protein
MLPDPFLAPARARARWSRAAGACVLAVLLGGCAARPAPASQAPLPTPAAEQFAPPAPAQPAVDATGAVLLLADRVRTMAPQELAQEIARLGEPRESAIQMLQLAAALAQARGPANLARAQALIQRAQAHPGPEAQALQPLARVLSAQLATQVTLAADVRRLEEQAERHNQQLQAAQRRIEQLNERLEAVRAIERSLPPGRTGNGQRP